MNIAQQLRNTIFELEKSNVDKAFDAVIARVTSLGESARVYSDSKWEDAIEDFHLTTGELAFLSARLEHEGFKVTRTPREDKGQDHVWTESVLSWGK